MFLKKLLLLSIFTLSSLYAQSSALEAYKKGNYKYAFELYTKDANSGNTTAQNSLSYLYFNGVGTKKDLKKGLFWLKKSAHGMNAQAQYDLGMMYLSGHNVIQNPKLAFTWFDSASDLGSVQAKYNEALMYYEGSVVDRNATKSLELLEDAAQAGHKKSIENIGRIYMQELKFKQARKWLKINVENGDTQAQYLLDAISKEKIGN